MSEDDIGRGPLSPYRLLKDPLPDGSERFPRRLPAENEELHLRQYLRVLRKHRQLVAAVFVAIVATTAIVNLTQTRLYTATARIQIERQAPKVAPVQGVEQVEAPVGDRYDYYQTQYKVLESRTIAARVIKALSLDADPRFSESAEQGATGVLLRSIRSGLGLRDATEEEPAAEQGVDTLLIDGYLAMLAISPLRNSRLVDVKFRSKHPDLSAEVANKHVEEYVAASLEQRLGVSESAQDFLEAELSKSRTRVNAAEAALNVYRKEKGIISLDGSKSDIVSERLGDLNQRHSEAEADRIRLEGQYRLIERRGFESLPDVVSSPLIQQLKQEVSKIEVEVAELSKVYMPGFPSMREAQAKESQAKARLQAEIGKIVEGIRSGYMAATSREDELARQLEVQRQKALSQKDTGAEYDTLARDVETARGLYGTLLQRAKDIDVAEQIRTTNVAVVDPAARPLTPSHPQTGLNLFLAAFAGILLGTGLAFLRDYFDDTVNTWEDVERRVGLPTLAVVPSFDSPSLGYGARGAPNGCKQQSLANGANELVVSYAPRSVVAEAYRTLRSAVLLSSAGSPPQVIAVTSGGAGEGKTVTVINIALALAASGGKVLVMDADIRKPRLHKIFDLPNGHGLSTYLAGQSPFESIVHSVPLNGKRHATNGDDPSAFDQIAPAEIFVVPAGPSPPDPAELLGSERMHRTLEMLREEYAYILIDTPPVLPVTDAVMIGSLSDGVVLVVRGHQTPVGVVSRSKERLLYGRARVLGVVLNDVDVSSADYAEYGRYSYAHYSSEARDLS